MSSSAPAPTAADTLLHRLDFLARAGEVLASSLDYEDTLQHVAQLCLPELGDLCVIDVCEDGVLHRVATAHVRPDKHALVEQMSLRNPLPGESPAPSGRVLASGRTELLDVVTPEVIASHTKDQAHADLIRAIGMRSHIAAPMRARGDVIGVLCLGITESDRRYGASDQALVEELARRVAFAVENAQLYRSAQREIERRRDVEDELRISEARVRAITEQSPLSMQRLAPDGRTIGVNRAWETLWGLRLEDLHGYNVLTDPQLEDKGIAPLLRRAFEGTPTSLPMIAYDRRISVPDAGVEDPDPVRWISAFAYPVRDDGGTIREVVLVHEDVTEARRAERKLRESEDRLNRALATGGMVVWDWDLASGHVECSVNAREVFGMDVGQREDFLASIHPDDLPRLHAATEQTLRDGAFGPIEFRLRPRGDGERWVQTRGHLERDETGAPSRMLGVTVDITSRRFAEDATRVLADAGEILGASLDYATTLDNLARVVVPRLADWFAVDLLTDEGELQRVAVHHPDPARVRTANELFRRYPPRRGQGGAWKVIETGEPEWMEDLPEDLIRMGAQDAEHAELLIGLQLRSYILVPLRARGATIGVLTLVQAESGRRYRPADVELALDLAGRAAAAVDNARLYDQLQVEHRRKDEFLATLAHELRNPLAPIRTGLALLQAAPDAMTATQTRRVMERQLAHMVRLIDDLLDLSRVTRGTIELQCHAITIGDVVASALEASRALVEAAGLTLEVDVAEPGLVLDADDTRLAQVLTNLLNNAAKFTPAGGLVRLRTRRVGDRLRLEVRDTGIGLDAAQCEQVFEMFVRAHPSSTAGGLGIGLTLARRLAELHGGRLWAQSEGPGRGSVFVLELPLASTPARVAEPPQAAAPGTPPKRRVLVVDDNVDAAETLQALLEFGGHEVRSAASGDAALALLDAFVPEVALLDIGLPGMSGYELAARLRRDPRTAQARLVALTGWGREEDRQRSREAGFDAHMTKPVDPEALFAVVHARATSPPAR